jgi:hypothetical protein
MLLRPACSPGYQDDKNEGDEIGGNRSRLSIARESHFREDGGEEDQREGGEGDVAGEVH